MNRDDNLKRRIENSVNAIKYLNEQGDELKAKDFAKKLGKILNSNSVGVYKANKLYEAAGMDKKSRKDEIRRRKGLESSLTSIITIAGLGAGIFFLSSNITGNAISDLTNSTSNIIGVVFLVIGLIASFFYFRKRKNK